MPAPRPPAVVIRKLFKRFEDVVAVRDLDLEVHAGECLGLLGPNGAGKTTTLEILVGLQPPSGGDVEVLGRRWGHADEALRARLGVSLQETRLPERLTVLEVVRLFRSFYPQGRPPAAVIEEVGLTDKAGTWTVKLSGGQRQRLALACALVGEPDLLVLDEPTTGLDPQARLRMGDTIRAQRDRGRTVVVSTHYMDEAQRLCDRVAVVDHGTRIALGTPAELIATLGGDVVVEIVAPPGALGEADLAPLAGVRAVRRTGPSLLLSTADSAATLRAVLDQARDRGVTLERLITRQATLEDVFVSLTGRQLRDE
ncbi:MAG TPA: ABC transporter ATP-binding protein [Polyangia bacterium]|jgi:ABC-2 type transport system ATP-binding protein